MRTEPKPKIGEGHAGAMGRKGIEELRAAVYPDSNVAQPSNYGLFGTKTPGEVAEDRRPDERDMDEEPARDSVLDKWSPQPDSGREDSGKDAREMERE